MKKYIKKSVRISLVTLLGILICAGCGNQKIVEEIQETIVQDAEEIGVLNNESNIFGTQESLANTESQQEITTESTETSSQAATETVAETSAEPELTQPSTSLTLLMVGDILLHTPVENAAQQADGTYDFTTIFENLTEDIQVADLAIVNQEVIIGGEELGISGYPAFNAPYAVGDALVEAGFDVVCHGTNHALDKGRKGILNCSNFWDENYPEIAVLGIHNSQESQDTIYIYEQNDMKIAILNYTYGTNGIALPDGMPYAVDMLEEQRVIADIRKAEELADFTIVCPHWGTEYQLEQSAAQEKWAQIFVRNGVDLVLGTHPHVIQPIEWVTDEETGHEMLVYYSLGNFVNGTSESGKGIANRMVGGMAEVTLERSEEGQVQIAEYGVVPVVCHLEQGINGVTVYKLEDYTEELAEKNQIRLQDAVFSKEYCEQLCEGVWADIWGE